MSCLSKEIVLTALGGFCIGIGYCVYQRLKNKSMTKICSKENPVTKDFTDENDSWEPKNLKMYGDIYEDDAGDGKKIVEVAAEHATEKLMRIPRPHFYKCNSKVDLGQASSGDWMFIGESFFGAGTEISANVYRSPQFNAAEESSNEIEQKENAAEFTAQYLTEKVLEYLRPYLIFEDEEVASEHPSPIVAIHEKFFGTGSGIRESAFKTSQRSTAEDTSDDEEQKERVAASQAQYLTELVVEYLKPHLIVEDAEVSSGHPSSIVALHESFFGVKTEEGESTVSSPRSSMDDKISDKNEQGESAAECAAQLSTEAVVKCFRPYLFDWTIQDEGVPFRHLSPAIDLDENYLRCNCKRRSCSSDDFVTASEGSSRCIYDADEDQNQANY